MCNSKLSEDDSELVENQYNSYISKNTLPEQVLSYIDLLQYRIKQEINFHEQTSEFSDATFEQFQKLDKLYFSLVKKHVDDHEKINSILTGILSNAITQADLIRDAQNELKDKYFNQKEKLAKGRSNAVQATKKHWQETPRKLLNEIIPGYAKAYPHLLNKKILARGVKTQLRDKLTSKLSEGNHRVKGNQSLDKDIKAVLEELNYPTKSNKI
jgi:hypothetical protein